MGTTRTCFFVKPNGSMYDYRAGASLDRARQIARDALDANPAIDLVRIFVDRPGRPPFRYVESVTR
jgi:hypothetical protein